MYITSIISGKKNIWKAQLCPVYEKKNRQLLVVSLSWVFEREKWARSALYVHIMLATYPNNLIFILQGRWSILELEFKVQQLIFIPALLTHFTAPFGPLIVMFLRLSLWNITDENQRHSKNLQGK